MLVGEWRAPLILGVGLAIFQQFTGINAVIYYSDRIFAAAASAHRTSRPPPRPGPSAWSTSWPRSSRSPTSTGWADGR
ncbi:MFS transporter [Catellatospora tritici]|uniref:MFS transporter n=1 Tax=Catellatospora tritici TaxID=2851566 RepID=UPI003558778B